MVKIHGGVDLNCYFECLWLCSYLQNNKSSLYLQTLLQGMQFVSPDLLCYAVYHLWNRKQIGTWELFDACSCIVLGRNGGRGQSQWEQIPRNRHCCQSIQSKLMGNQGGNSIDFKNLGPNLGPKLGPILGPIF